jgi:hypothetical protein
MKKLPIISKRTICASRFWLTKFGVPTNAIERIIYWRIQKNIHEDLIIAEIFCLGGEMRFHVLFNWINQISTVSKRLAYKRVPNVCKVYPYLVGSS